MDNTPPCAQLGVKITAAVLLFMIHAIIAWDVVAGMTWGSRATVSAILGDWTRRFPIIVLAIGVLIGHIVWPLQPKE